jgi:CheY-like chemotaxis protein
MKLADATVLVVDDDPELLDIFSSWMERSGCKVFPAANGAEALVVLVGQKVDALITDLRMPIVDGVTLVRRIYEMEMAIPSMLFVSGFNDVDPREIYALGVEWLIEKPLRRQDLIDALGHSLLEREEMWLTPMPGRIEHGISIEIRGLNEAGRADTFELGRGGCCFLSPEPVSAGEAIDLTVRVTGENVTVRAQCEARWYCAPEARAGVEFRYVEPEGRRWVVDRIKSAAMRSFIPGC